MSKVNLCAGPSKLPESVYKALSEMIINYQDQGISLLSISHRDPVFIDIYHSIINHLRLLISLPKEYEILLMAGGATAQFAAVPMNLNNKGKALYLDSGYWAKKAIKEAENFIEIDKLSLDQTITDYSSYDYVHYTENETIDGTQFKSVPGVDIPLVCDMSSSFLSKPIEIEKYDLIYAGAQKNIGLPSISVILIKKSLLAKTHRKSPIPQVLDYALTAKTESLNNTPNVIGWAGTELVLRDLWEKGGLQYIAKLNQQKSDLLYDYIDGSKLYCNTVPKDKRSQMNVVFQLNDPDLTDIFLAYSEKHNIYGLRGHRSVGGCRASLYNAVSLKDVECLISVMKDFENYA
ncbi:3-phosphoserine/phosphohydroxythreonine transaminase [Fangia hongkongensis]|uniref:3-phosphoserine/phosphohydroxythreonine transaminase n=1 Tax=Fangia hongkongensis TaxID=270495 RepID=UPI00036AC85D|nr:3-phosphoserine/phosphohydroxythreonine transaminase [Fangia hongkongensis]MBK2126012.1 3-phosphoserine/phosphohydroxythreonine transaminase [Fangia hongkongensis]